MAYLGSSVIGEVQAVPPALALLDLFTPQDDHLAPDPSFVSGAVTVPANNPKPTAATGVGRLSPGFGGDFFGRVHLVRSRQYTGSEPIQELIADWGRNIDLGNLLQAESFAFLVLNLDREAQHQITNVTLVSPTGFTVLPDVFPISLEPFDDQTFTVDVSLDGPPAIDSQVIFELDAQPDIILYFTGQRVVVFAHRPQSPMVEELQYKTDVMIARNGLEQRVAARIAPRLAYEMEYLLQGAERAQARNEAFGWGTRVFGVPAWHEAQALTAALSAGATAIPVDTRYSDYRDFGASNLGILWRSYTDFEVFRILTRSDGQLDLVDGLSGSHAAGTLVMPIRLAYLDKRNQAPRYPIGPQRFHVRWRSTDGINPVRLDAASPFTPYTYKGDPAFLDPNFVEGTLSEEIVFDYDEVDPDSGGPFAVFGHRDAPPNSITKTWFAASAADKWTIKALIHQLQGRRRAFWIPTFGDDFILQQPLSAGSNGFDADPTGYAQYVAQQSPRADVVVFKRDGSAPLMREITASQDPGGGTESFTVDSNWGEDVPLSNVERVSLLLRARFDSDVVTIQHEQEYDGARLEIPLVEVIQ